MGDGPESCMRGSQKSSLGLITARPVVRCDSLGLDSEPVHFQKRITL